MANKITDLTGYTWVANSGELSLPSGIGEYKVNFKLLDSTAFTNLTLNNLLTGNNILYDEIEVYSFDTGNWSDDKYKAIVFDSDDAGEDGSNTHLINFLEDNGTLSKPSTASMYLGTTEIEKVYLGSTEIEKIYLGENQIL